MPEAGMKNPDSDSDSTPKPEIKTVRYSKAAAYYREYRRRNPERVREWEKRYRASDKGKAARKRFQSSQRAIEIRKRYASSEKGKAARAAWRRSERGRETLRRYHLKNRDKISARNHAYRAKPEIKARLREELRERYAEHHALNLCPRCNREKVPGKSRCAVHLAYAAKWKRAKLAKQKALVDAPPQAEERGSGA